MSIPTCWKPCSIMILGRRGQPVLSVVRGARTHLEQIHRFQRRKRMNLRQWTSLATLAIAMTFVGCGNDASNGGGDSNSTSNATTETTTVAVLCGDCGEQKGADSCCAADSEICGSCNLHKGTALCCAALADDAKGKDICTGCGYAADAGHTCPTDGEVCKSCGLQKGSDACCKLKS